MLRNFDPSTLLNDEKTINEASAILENFKLTGEGNPKDLWDARKIVESAIHPDTGEILPAPFRMAGYTPFNGPVCVAMILASTTPTLLFWNWVNQSQNALVNYYNRNASSNMSNETLAKSYAGAVSAALIVAFGVSQVIQRSFKPAKAKQMLKFVAFPSSVVASCSNAYVMRAPEMDTGITVVDAQGKDVLPGSLSKEAAKKAVYETVVSRAYLQVPTFAIPPVVMSLPPIAAMAASSTLFGVVVTAFLTTTAFGLGLPAAVAVFPQKGEIDVEDLEPEFQKAAGDAKTLFYNKGL